jgi:hypothetical protein
VNKQKIKRGMLLVGLLSALTLIVYCTVGIILRLLIARTSTDGGVG